MKSDFGELSAVFMQFTEKWVKKNGVGIAKVKKRGGNHEPHLVE